MDHIWEYVNYVSISVNKMGKHTKCKQCNKEMQALSIQMKRHEAWSSLKITGKENESSLHMQDLQVSKYCCRNFSKLGLFTFLCFEVGLNF